MHKLKLIDDWRQCHKFWSVRLQLAGVFLLGLFQEFPDALTTVWTALPADVRSTFPDSIVQWIGFVCLAAGIVARIIRQDKLNGNSADKAV